MLCFRLLLTAILALLSTPALLLAAETPETQAAPEFAYFVQMGGLREGRTTTWISTRLDPGNAESVFQSGYNRIGVEANAGFFEWKYGLCGCVKLLAAPQSKEIVRGPALQAALAHGRRYEIGDVEIEVYAPGVDEFQFKIWRLDISGLTDTELMQLCAQQEDRDGDGFNDPPGKQIGSLRWEIDCPELGYLRDIEITADVLREMQFGLRGHSGGE
ncbi:hypothetical protein IT575_06405 [bacterium]|nr:hypothetical protein [bacterium]